MSLKNIVTIAALAKPASKWTPGSTPHSIKGKKTHLWETHDDELPRSPNKLSHMQIKGENKICIKKILENYDLWDTTK